MTDRDYKSAYGRIKAQNERTNILLEKIISTTQTKIFWKDENRRFLGANKAFLDYYGFPNEDFIRGKNDEDMGWHDDDEPFRNDELMVLQTGKSTYRVPVKCMSQGKWRHIVASKSPVFENGKIIGLVGSFDDVTEEVERQERIVALNEELKEALERAEKANDAKTRFLANVTHDMRTPLNGILGFAGLARDCQDINQIKDYIEKINISGSLLFELINDTLEISRLVLGKRELKLRTVPADNMLDNLLESVRAEAETNRIRFEADLNLKELGYINVDSLKVSKILLNLLTNAIKFTPADGMVTLRGEVMPLENEAENINVRICRFTVQDTGIGISKEFITHMFEPFEQVLDDNGDARNGVGLGLTITKKLLELLNGTVEVSSEVGKGTTFVVKLPVEVVPEVKAKENVDDYANISLADRCILLCEDNSLNCEITTTILEMSGMKVITAVNGQAGLDIFASSEPGKIDAILMDIRMPVMDGLTAVRKIRSLTRYDAAYVPVLALSANAFEEDMELSRAAGMDDHLTKPINTLEMLRRLRKYIGIYDDARKNSKFKD